ncbi:Phosphoenolpyruvate/phosphate translocator [Seminavis robusta]|uniref:Phosphoenolpyruvate/phosphate translocator n=1 Tax=Seminavis robusta TaxID=568900 RepID=A0A9N8EJJ1_9STRA|nr:Phosphoenolpyruvate/phosphate translocator [Seminavis robusta]|eukprot:Sro1348_g265030.1 Phosphoenolpyruvate/phosphate translocator (541) ;mRNA; f:18571-20400
MPPQLSSAVPTTTTSSPIHKSKSCPADFSGDQVDPLLMSSSAGSVRTPPVSNGMMGTNSRRSRRSGSGGKFTHGLNGNGTSTIAMDLTKSSSATGASITGSTNQPVPGRPRRRGNKNVIPVLMGKTKKDPAQSLRYRFLNARWMKYPMKGTNNSYASLILAVVLWYSLGVVSITTSNLLMMKPTRYNQVGGVPPLVLTLQQLIIGSMLLWFLLRIRFMQSPGVQPWPSPSAAAIAAENSRRKNLLFHHNRPTNSNSLLSDLASSVSPNLVLAGVCFATGFFATNFGFLASSAAFVETVKAAEPITSAAVAVMWGIEVLSGPEMLSLGSIVAGVLISTLAHSSAAAQGTDAGASSMMQSLQSCLVVMTANLCFSFRGLYQKLFRASPEGSAAVIDDLNLQFRMQQIGVMLLIGPVIMLDLRELLGHIWEVRSGIAIQYVALALVNGIAFTTYNLASTFILTRISVVHHAALNCIRRIFAIIVTSIYFRIPVTVIGILGFFVSFGGFMSFTHYKMERQKQPKPLSSLLPVSAAASDNSKAQV